MKRLSLLLLLSGITLACCVRYLHPDGDDAGKLLFSVLRNASAYSAAFAAGVVATLCLGQVGALRELFGKQEQHTALLRMAEAVRAAAIASPEIPESQLPEVEFFADTLDRELDALLNATVTETSDGKHARTAARSWKGCVEISLPDPATPMTHETPQPRWAREGRV